VIFQRGDDRKSLGASGEKAAARHLAKQGFAILERNYRCPLGEIDLVARKGPLLVFAEVKTRRSEQYGAPETAVGFRKQKKLVKLAQFYIKQKDFYGLQCRFDVVSVRWNDKGRPAVDHIPAAFFAEF
jgi:putative endonuclease